jgi:putative endonuclease
MANAAAAWFFYMVRCRDGSLYSGITRDLEERVRKHSAGTGARYTLTRRPVSLVYSERRGSLSEAMKREHQVKGWSKARKEQLAVGGSAPSERETRLKLEALSSLDPAVKYGAAKALMTAAREDPEALRPHTDYFVGLLESDNSILKWTAIDILGCVAGVSGARIDFPVKKLFAMLDSGRLITANHAIAAMAAIAAARPGYRARITTELLKVGGYAYETEECRNIVLGKAILGFGSYVDRVSDRKEIVDFVRRHANNPRSATSKKALAFLKKYGSEEDSAPLSQSRHLRQG